MKAYPNVKINLGLSILRKLPDGYHDIETLFVPYHGLHDELEILPCDGSGDRIVLEGGSWDPQSDLTLKAVKLLRRDFDFPPVEIRLVKHAPAGAGLGGGSSDASFALRMVNNMFSLGLDDSGLAAYASELGSDCPFFIYNRPMTGEGRGEILNDYALDLEAWRIEVRIPEGVHVSTRDAYSRVVPREREPGGRMPLREALALPVERWREVLVNDFEPSVFARWPQVEAEKRRFYEEGAVYASMSGSGSSVFGIFRK